MTPRNARLADNGQIIPLDYYGVIPLDNGRGGMVYEGMLIFAQSTHIQRT